MELVCYGGVREIGGNKVLLSSGETRVFLDFGMSFKKRGEFYEDFLQPRTNNALRDLLRLGIVPAIDGVYRDDLIKLPELPKELPKAIEALLRCGIKSYGEILEESGGPFVSGVLVTHGHADHYQDIALLHPEIPIYSGEITRRLILAAEEIGRGGFDQEFVNAKIKSVTRRGSQAFFPNAWYLKADPFPRHWETFSGFLDLGDLSVTSLAVDHSVPGASAFYLETQDGKSLLYTGDLRFHGRRPDYNDSLFSFVESHHPDVLLIEGTRITETEADDELLVEEECKRIVSEAQGLVLIAFAWKDTTRFETLRRVAASTGRQLVISPKLAYLLNKLSDLPEAAVSDFQKDSTVKVYLKRKESMLYSPDDYTNTKYDAGFSIAWDRKDPSSIRTDHLESGVRAYDIRSDPKHFIVHLDYYDLNELIDLEPPKGSILIRAISEPFNEEMTLEEQRLIRWLETFQINQNVTPPFKPIYVHASGHASGQEIRDFIKRASPKFVIPLHTEHPEVFAHLLDNTLIQIIQPEYGVPLEFS